MLGWDICVLPSVTDATNTHPRRFFDGERTAFGSDNGVSLVYDS